MFDYTSSLKKGLETASLAENYRQEIIGVFKELKEQVLTETKQSIAIDIKTLSYNPPIADAIAFLNMQPRKTYKAIMATNKLVANSPTKELAHWVRSRAGYPCTISFDDHKYICEDKASLQNTLTILLESPSTGEKIFALLKLSQNPIAEPTEIKTLSDSTKNS